MFAFFFIYITILPYGIMNVFCINGHSDLLKKRTYLGLQLVLSEISDDSPLDLKAIRLLALYLKNSDAAREEAVAQARQWLEETSNAMALTVSAVIFSYEGDLENALKACHSGQNLEMMALTVQIALKLDRIDIAERTVKAMSAVDDDATLTQLAAAWVGLHQGGSKVQEAFYIFQELGDKFSWTVRLHNGLAACQIRMGRWEDAEAELLQAFEKNAKDADTLGNLAMVSIHLGKPSQRYMTLLQGVSPNHALLARTQAANELFEKAVER